MEVDNKKSVEEISSEFVNMDFQWIKGDLIGSMETFKNLSEEGDQKFVEFESGNRINLSYLPEFMANFPKSPINHSELSSKVPIENSREINNNSQTVAGVTSIEYTNKEKTNPIFSLLSKQKENWVDVNITIRINLPPKDLYNILVDSFDDSEEDIIEYSLESVDIHEIKKSLKESISRSYYGSKESSTNKLVETEKD